MESDEEFWNVLGTHVVSAGTNNGWIESDELWNVFGTHVGLEDKEHALHFQDGATVTFTVALVPTYGRWPQNVVPRAIDVKPHIVDEVFERDTGDIDS